MLGVGLAAILGCTELPELHDGACGNGAIDPAEDCDGFDQLGTACRPPGAPGECRLDCTPSADGTPSACPSGFGCDQDSVCRRATGSFQALPERIEGNASSLLAGDFDGDGRNDVIALEPVGELGFTKIRAHWFNESAVPVGSWVSPKPLAAPAVADVSGDGRADLTFSTGQVGVLLGEADRTLIAETFPSYVLPEASRFMAILDRDVDDSPAILILTERDGAFGLFRLDETSGMLTLMAELPGGTRALSAEPVLGNVFEDDASYPCHDVALAYRDAESVSIYSACQRDPGTGVVHFRETAEVTSVALDPPAPLDRGLLLSDVDGDGHLDLLIGAGGRLYVAPGDGAAFGVARPYAVVGSPDGEDMPVPLAAGDISGDGAADLIYPSYFLLSTRADDGSIGYSLSHESGAGWSEARIADLNDNGVMDVVAASSNALDIDFFNGTGGGRLNPFVIPTTRPVRHLAVGDFDGDLIDDLAFVQPGSTPEQDDDVSIAFGNTAGAPGPVVPTAHVEHVEQLVTLEENEELDISTLFVTYTQKNANGAPSSALAIFGGSGDRSLSAPLELTTFAADGSVDGRPSLSLTTGAFTRAGQLDVVPMSTTMNVTNEDLRLWLLPNIGSRRSVPKNLGWTLDATLAPIINPETSMRGISLRMASGDLDGDELDELVVVAPEAGGETCTLCTAEIASGEAPSLTPRQTLRFEDRCTREPELAIQDLDGNGAAEIVFLTGAPAAERRLLVLWNDGTGGFDVANAQPLPTGVEAPAGFTLFRPTPDAPILLAFVSSSRVGLFGRVAEGRFDDLGTLAELDRGTGIAAADIDGDRVIDLAVADAGNVRIFKAELAR